jgi:vancomycin resistance protein YoaR
MCQVSSTVYNAALMAGLKITERHPHSQPVSYVPAGRDATTFTDKDLRFMNSTRHPLILRVCIAGKMVKADIFSLPQ